MQRSSFRHSGRIIKWRWKELHFLSYKAVFKGHAGRSRPASIFQAFTRSSLTQGDGYCYKPSAQKQKKPSTNSCLLRGIFPTFFQLHGGERLMQSGPRCIQKSLSYSAFYDCFLPFDLAARLTLRPSTT